MESFLLTGVAIIVAVVLRRSVMYKSDYRNILAWSSLWEYIIGLGYAVFAYTCYHAGFFELKIVPLVSFSASLTGPRFYELLQSAINTYLQRLVLNKPDNTDSPDVPTDSSSK